MIWTTLPQIMEPYSRTVVFMTSSTVLENFCSLGGGGGLAMLACLQILSLHARLCMRYTSVRFDTAGFCIYVWTGVPPECSTHIENMAAAVFSLQVCILNMLVSMAGKRELRGWRPHSDTKVRVCIAIVSKELVIIRASVTTFCCWIVYIFI
jgi:hypothetical protein